MLAWLKLTNVSWCVSAGSERLLRAGIVETTATGPPGSEARTRVSFIGGKWETS